MACMLSSLLRAPLFSTDWGKIEHRGLLATFGLSPSELSLARQLEWSALSFYAKKHTKPLVRI